MAHIFISYSRVDEPFARQLATSLSQLGADVWIDVEDIPVGMKWSRAIQEGLDVSHVMLVVISPESMASHNVEDEWQYYLDQKKPVIPLMLRPTKLHFQLSRIQYINFQRQPYETALHQLHAELSRNGVHLNPIPGPAPAAAANVPLHAPPTQPSSPPERKLPVMWLALGAVLLVVGVGLGVFLSSPNRGTAPTTQPTLEPTAAIISTATPDNLGQQQQIPPQQNQQQLPTNDPYSQSQIGQADTATYDDGNIRFQYPAGWLVERVNDQGSNSYLIASNRNLFDAWKDPQNRRTANIPDGQFAALIIPNVSSGSSNLTGRDWLGAMTDSLSQAEKLTFGQVINRQIPVGDVTYVVGVDTSYRILEIMVIEPHADNSGSVLVMGWAAQEQAANFVSAMEGVANTLTL
jgi:hypothetical protein